MLNLLFILLSFPVMSQNKLTLEQYSHQLNQSLPEIYDSVTKLRQTTVENNHLVYHFLVDATLKESEWALPKVKGQVMGTICKNAHQRHVLHNYRAIIIYRYENTKGQSLGEFLIPSAHCSR